MPVLRQKNQKNKSVFKSCFGCHALFTLVSLTTIEKSQPEFTSATAVRLAVGRWCFSWMKEL
jgi:hypothetical protein